MNLDNINKLPDFTTHGYQTLKQLQHNIHGGRITYQAMEIETNQQVVIKQFTFANKIWDGYKEIEREINALKSLNHHGIPKFLAQFDSGDGLCLVQEYIPAQPLSTNRSFTPEDIKSIAIQLLEILVYLQARIPPIIHKDIKPENILIDDDNKAYLIDFGLARVGNQTMNMSSIQGGTLGFMPPEQLHRQKLTEASDLYGLGASLICLITQTKSAKIGELIDFSTNKINFKTLASKYSSKLIRWLEKMVEPNPINRYQNAETALKDLQPVYVIRIPEVRLSETELNLTAKKLGQKLSYQIDVSNSIPETVLQGEFEVLPHPSDTITDDTHNWIDVEHKEFKSNDLKCKIVVDTSNLMAGKIYERCLQLKSNASTEIYQIPVKIKTAPIPIENQKIPYRLLLYLLIISIISSSQIILFPVIIQEVESRIERIWRY